MRTIKAQPGQTLLDVALAQCGDVAAVAEMAVLNNVSLTDALVPGTDVQVPEWPNNPVRIFFQANGINSATRATKMPWSGIGVWAIEVDFIVS